MESATAAPRCGANSRRVKYAGSWFGEDLRGLRQGVGRSSLLKACLSRVRRWPPPPQWSRRDWLEEAEADASLTELRAEREFDAQRGVPRELYIRRRVLEGLLSRYRREWRAYLAPRRRAIQGESESAVVATLLGRDLAGKMLSSLSELDQQLLRMRIVDGRSERVLAREFGVTQQAISKRVLGAIRRMREGGAQRK